MPRLFAIGHSKKTSGNLKRDVESTRSAVPVADPTPARNDRKLSPSVRNKDGPYMVIQLLQVSPVHGLSVSG